MTFEITGLDKFQKSLSNLSKQIDYAMSRTLNNLAFDAQASLAAELKHGMNVRVNTSKAFAVDKSSKTNLSATVRLKNDWHKYAIPQHFNAGDSLQIGFEKTMIARGYMTANHSAVPIKKMGKAKYKTVSNATRRGIRSYSKMFVVPTNNKNKRTAHLAPGVWTRLKRKPKPVILFTQEAQYRKKFDMRITIDKVIKRRAQKYFNKNMAQALRTAR